METAEQWLSRNWAAESRTRHFGAMPTLLKEAVTENGLMLTHSGKSGAGYQFAINTRDTVQGIL